MIRSIRSAYRITRFVAPILVIILCAQFVTHLAQAQTEQPASLSVFADGLNNPRGLKFGPDGYLYVAEGGTAMYALETDTVAGFPGPDAAGSGTVVRVNDDLIVLMGDSAAAGKGYPNEFGKPKELGLGWWYGGTVRQTWILLRERSTLEDERK